MISEPQLIRFLKLILENEKQISLQEFIDRVEKAFNLSKEDLKISKTRPNERMYEQRCRNLNCHKNFPDNCEYKNQIFRLK